MQGRSQEFGNTGGGHVLWVGLPNAQYLQWNIQITTTKTYLTGWQQHTGLCSRWRSMMICQAWRSLSIFTLKRVYLTMCDNTKMVQEVKTVIGFCSLTGRHAKLGPLGDICRLLAVNIRVRHDTIVPDLNMALRDSRDIARISLFFIE
jgi:hypothetical protein